MLTVDSQQPADIPLNLRVHQCSRPAVASQELRVASVGTSVLLTADTACCVLVDSSLAADHINNKPRLHSTVYNSVTGCTAAYTQVTTTKVQNRKPQEAAGTMAAS